LGKELAVRRVEDASLWDDFVASSPQGTVFSTSAWLRAAGGAQGGVPRMVGVYRGGELVAGAGFVHVARGFLAKATTPAVTPYGGFLYRPRRGKRGSEAESFNMNCAELLIDYLQKNYGNVFLVHAPGFRDVRPFTWSGWRESVRYTYIVDISDIDMVWDMLERRVRTVIRNAESSLELGDAIDPTGFTKLYEHIYRDRGWPFPYSPGAVESLVDEIMGTGRAEMRTVRDADGTVISSMVLVWDEKCVYSWISGSIPDRNASGAFSLLFWDAVKRHSGRRARLDMVGANIPSIAFFKKGFGGTLTPYYVTDYYSSGISRLLFTSYSFVKRRFRPGA